MASTGLHLLAMGSALILQVNMCSFNAVHVFVGTFGINSLFGVV